MTRTISTLRFLTLGAVLIGTGLVAGCGSSPERVTSTTVTERTTSAPPPPAVSTTTTTTEQVRQLH
jgi:hypothetical protein